jgi:hypothetical protein
VKLATIGVITSIAVVALTAGCAGHSGNVEAVSGTERAEVRSVPVPADVVTPPAMPPFQATDEVTPTQLERALDEGKAVRHEVEWVEREEAAASGDVAAGEYLVTYLITPADDYYDLEAAQSNLPAHHTTVTPGSAHVAVVVRDAADGRIVQGLDVRATLRPESSSGESRTVVLPYGWHPVLNRYGENVLLPTGPFTLSVRIAMPTYRRLGRVNGDRFRGDVIARFAHVVVPDDSLPAAAERLARGDSHQATELARAEGEAIAGPLSEMLRGAGARGSRARSADYDVAVVVERARDYWGVRAGKLSYVSADSSSAMNHIGVSVRDVATGRLIPELSVRVTVLNSRRKEIGTYEMPFMWDPWLNHYGLNVPALGEGRYTIRVRAEAPAFRRYGSGALKKFNRAVSVDVRGVRVNELP